MINLHAYEKYNAIFNKPDFKDIYYPTVVFVQPFVNKINEDLIWHEKRQEWCITKNPSSILTDLTNHFN